MSVPLLFFVVCVALVSAGEEPLSLPEMDPHHHVTTVCIQVHGSSALCGPIVKPEAAQQFAAAEAARGSLRNLPERPPGADAARANQFQAAEFRDAMAAGPPNDAVLQGFYENVPVYQMRSAAGEVQKPKAGQPCSEPTSRSVLGGPVVSVVQPPTYGLHTPLIGSGLGYGGLGGIGSPGSVVTVQQPSLGGYMRSAEPGPAARTIPFAPFGLEKQQPPQAQQMRASQFAAARSQQYAAMRAAADSDCDDNPGSARQYQHYPQMRASPFNSPPQGQQMRQVYSQPAFASVSDPQRSANAADLAKQCAEQELELKKKSEEIFELKKQVDRLSSMTEKTTVEQKTVSVKSASSGDSQKEISDAKDPQNPKKKK